MLYVHHLHGEQQTKAKETGRVVDEGARGVLGGVLGVRHMSNSSMFTLCDPTLHAKLTGLGSMLRQGDAVRQSSAKDRRHDA